ncbi:unnamed protein product [Somion occarium]|uniref:RING-type domain-containing protein n=1 Tax=Somion occarium TaxID=3059160 RepID=A0ABP1CVJ8_9APHY
MAPSPDNLSSPQGRADPSRIAPYLTHVVSHHGQLTLIPPQNAGRIRKSKNKPVRSDRRRENPEPRFNIAAPAPSRRAHTTSGRLQRPIQQSRLPRDPDIPDEPPPSFEEAISTPPYTPPQVNVASSTVSNAETQSHVHHTPTSSDSPRSSFEQQDLDDSERASALAHERSGSRGEPLSSIVSTPSYPEPMNVPAISRRHQDLLSIAPASSLPDIRQASQDFLIPNGHSSHNRRQASPSPTLPPRSPLSQSDSNSRSASNSNSSSSNSDINHDSRFSMEFLEPESSWSADLAGGLTLTQRVERERVRIQAAESTAALVPTPRALTSQLPEVSSTPNSNTTPESAPCTGRTTLQPLRPLSPKTHDPHDRNTTQSPSSSAADDDDSPAESELWVPIPSSPRSHHPLRRLFSPSKYHLPSSGSVSPVSSSPQTMSPHTSPFASARPWEGTKPWESTMTLSSSVSASPTKKSALSLGLAIKRKESVVFQKLFKSKGRERETSPASDSTGTEEDIDSWEVVEKGALLDEGPVSNRTEKGKGKESPSPPSRSPLRHLHTSAPAFLNRPVRHATSPPSSSSSPSFPILPFNTSRATLTPDSPSGSSEQSGHSQPEPGSSQSQSQSPEKKARRPPPPVPPRRHKPSLGQSPNVVWKASPNTAGASSPMASRRPPPPPPPPPPPAGRPDSPVLPAERPPPPIPPRPSMPLRSVASLSSWNMPTHVVSSSQQPAPPRSSERAVPAAPVVTSVSAASAASDAQLPSHVASTPVVARQETQYPMAMSSSRNRPTNRLAPISVPPASVYEDESDIVPPRRLSVDSTSSDSETLSYGSLTYTSNTPNYSPAVLPSPFSNPTLNSFTPPRTPTTPTRHYPGRPLPQPPQEYSPLPLGRPLQMMTSVPSTPQTRGTGVLGAEHVQVQGHGHGHVQRIPSPSPSTSRRVSPPVPMTRGVVGVVPEYSQYTDLDLLVSRLEEGNNNDGRNYEDLLLVSEIVGPALPSPNVGSAAPKTEPEGPLVGSIEVARRRVTKDGRVKLKLVLLGVAVDKCGICLSQFKENEMAGLLPGCQHAFHERCLRRWLAQKRVCPMCRSQL